MKMPIDEIKYLPADCGCYEHIESKYCTYDCVCGCVMITDIIEVDE